MSLRSEPRIAIAVHLYYEAQWPELAALIRNIRHAFTLFVSVQQGSGAASLVHADFPDAIVRPMPDLGRDILPFLSLIPELQAYDLVCKLHTKRNSPYYRPWRIEALRGVLGGPALVDLIVGAFGQMPELMMAGSGATYADGPLNMYGSEPDLRAFQPDLPPAFGFFAGTMFWTRPALFADFATAFPADRFTHHSAGDGQLEHGVERLFGFRVATLGGYIGLTRTSVGVPTLDVVSAGETPGGYFLTLLETTLRPRYAGFPADWYAHAALVAKHALGAMG